MAKLTDTQLIVLSRAAAHEDGIATLPDKMPKAAAAKVAASLIARKLMREIKAKAGVPVWREDADNRAFSLVITAAGRKAIGVEDGAGDAPHPSSTAPASPDRESLRKASKRGVGKSGESATHASTAGPSEPITLRENSKSAQVVKMLSKPSGVTLDAIVDATGWLPHTTRAALTGLRKKGFAITRERQQGKNSVYRIVETRPAVAASA